MNKKDNKQVFDPINLTTLLKCLQYDNCRFFDYYAIDSKPLDDFKVESDCFYNDDKTSTEIVIDKLIERFVYAAEYAALKGINCDLITFNLNYGVVCDAKCANDYKQTLEHCTKQLKQVSTSEDFYLQSNNKELLKAYNKINKYCRRAVKVCNDSLDENIFSNLAAFRQVSVDYTYYVIRPDINNSYDVGTYDGAVRQEPNTIRTNDEVFLVSFSEFIDKMNKKGFEITNGSCEEIRNYNQFLDGFKNGEIFNISGDYHMIMEYSKLNDGFGSQGSK